MNKALKITLYIILSIFIILLYNYIKQSFFNELSFYNIVPFVAIFLLYRVMFPKKPKILKDEYYLKDGNSKIGPFTLLELMNKDLSFETMIWNDDVDKWVPAKKIEILRSALFKRDFINKKNSK